MSLADVLNKAKRVGAVSETEKAGKLLRAKGGKAAAPGGTTPRRTNIAEKMAVSAQRQELGKAEQQKDIADTFMDTREAEQAQRKELADKDLEQQRTAMENDLRRKEDALFKDLERAGLDLQSSRDIAKVEQLGFLMGLQDEKYIMELKDLGARKRLEKDSEFKIALQQDIFKEYMDLREQDIAFEKMLKADARTFKKEMAQMDISTAMKLMKANIDAANQRSIMEGVAGMATAAAGADWDKIGASYDSKFGSSSAEGSTVMSGADRRTEAGFTTESKSGV